MTADAVVVLGGHGARVGVGVGLVREGFAPMLALSSGCPPPQPDGVEVVPFTPRPFNTRGEASAVAELARKRRWRSIVVVTSGYHIRRARLLFERAVAAETTFVTAPYPRLLLPLAVPKEAAKLAYELTLGREARR
jgi:hypothetical protein